LFLWLGGECHQLPGMEGEAGNSVTVWVSWVLPKIKPLISLKIKTFMLAAT